MKVCAIISIYNEEDIIEQSLNRLISSGIDIYIIDNGSTDSSGKICERYIDRGVINVERLEFFENGVSVYNWTKLLRHKENISKLLDYDWFIHADADEIRESPWSDLSLKEAIDIVDKSGYNLINFKLYNFLLYEGIRNTGNFEQDFDRYTTAQKFNSMQVKAWKKTPSIDLVTHGGHLALIDNPKLYPLRFILKHYPARSIAQAVKKINLERKDRFSDEDKRKGWHVQYDHLPRVDELLKSSLTSSVDDSVFFNLHNEICRLLEDYFLINLCVKKFNAFILDDLDEGFIKKFINHFHSIDLDNVNSIYELYQSMLKLLSSGDYGAVERDESNLPILYIIEELLLLKSVQLYLGGNPHLFDLMPQKIRIIHRLMN
jgi:glycosyltransferase involved in cell wall biosynthesis